MSLWAESPCGFSWKLRTRSERAGNIDGELLAGGHDTDWKTVHARLHLDETGVVEDLAGPAVVQAELRAAPSRPGRAQLGSERLLDDDLLGTAHKSLRVEEHRWGGRPDGVADA